MINRGLLRRWYVYFLRYQFKCYVEGGEVWSTDNMPRPHQTIQSRRMERVVVGVCGGAKMISRDEIRMWYYWFLVRKMTVYRVGKKVWYGGDFWSDDYLNNHSTAEMRPYVVKRK